MELNSILTTILPKTAVSSDVASFTVANPLVDKSKPACVAWPKDFSELQNLIKLANEKKFALVPVSSTGAHFRGGIVCKEDHVVVDLSPWKEIMWVNRRNLVCLVQPGVTYGELLPALEAQGMTIPTPLAPRSGKSVLAAMMDREPTIWPRTQWEIQDPVASTEFIFGTGDQFRTGSAGAKGTLEQQRSSGGAQKGPLGPSGTDFQKVVQGSQGSMGIVTWISLRCENKPTVEKTYLLGADLDKLISYVYDVQRPFLGEHSFILNRTAARMLMNKDAASEYICLQNIAGFDRMPKERLKFQEEDIKGFASRHGLSLEKSNAAVAAVDLLNTARNAAGEKDWRKAQKGECLSIIIMTTLDRTPEFIRVFAECAGKNKFDEKAIGIYIQPIVQNHSCHVEFMVPYDPAEIGKIRKLENEAVRALNSAHAFFSRPYGTAEKIVFSNNPDNTALLKTVKGIFDPNRVLNPGKFGL
jgi:FAD/FMN-containing dehydrogenase